MKRKRVIKLLLLFVVFFVAIIGIKADDDVDIKFTVKDALGSLSKISSKADYCKAAGCRTGSGTFGIRVTVVNRDGIRVKGTKTLDYLHGTGSYGTGEKTQKYKTEIVKNVKEEKSISVLNMNQLPTIVKKGTIGARDAQYTNYYWEQSYRAYVAPVIQFPNSWNPNFDNVVTYFRNAVSEFNSYMNSFDKTDLKTLQKELKTTILGKILEKAGYKIDLPNCDAVNKLSEVYIMIEPISTVTIGSTYAWWDGEPLKDDVIVL